jgi:chloramphenicol-sensitive protein RarD
MSIKPPVSRETSDESRAGFFFALSAYLIWGFLALFWKATSHIDPIEVTVHRAVWSLPFAGMVLWLMGRTSDILPTLKNPKSLGILLICSIMISVNWAIFVWAISVDRTIETALAYYINPLLSIALGAVVLGERFNQLQFFAIVLAFIAVLILTFLGGAFPWISLSLAGTFAAYGLLRKTVDVGPTQGFFVEILLLFPFALGYLLWLGSTGSTHFMANHWSDNVLLMMTGPATSIPLILYANGAKRLRLATIGMMQYIAPTMIFLIGLFVFGEAVGQWQWVAFGLIWCALFVYTWSLVKQSSHNR